MSSLANVWKIFQRGRDTGEAKRRSIQLGFGKAFWKRLLFYARHMPYDYPAQYLAVSDIACDRITDFFNKRLTEELGGSMREFLGDHPGAATLVETIRQAATGTA